MSEDIISGGPVLVGEARHGVWAKHPFVGSRSHAWNIIHETEGNPTFMIETMCGIQTVATDSVPLLHEGNWPRCKHCQSKTTNERKTV